MKVIINGYGLVDFKPTKIYRFDGRDDMAQLKGKVRIQRPNLDVRSYDGQDWIDHDFWFTLDQIKSISVDDINQLTRLQEVTDNECKKELHKNKVTEESDVLKDYKYIRYDFNGTEFSIIQRGNDILFKCGGVEFNAYDVLKDFYNFDWSVFTPACGDERSEEDFDDTDIGKEIQRVLTAMKELDLLDPAEEKIHQSLVHTLSKLYNIQKEI